MMAAGEKIDKEARKILMWALVITFVSVTGGGFLGRLLSSSFNLPVSLLSMRLICQFLIFIVLAIVFKVVLHRKRKKNSD